MRSVPLLIDFDRDVVLQCHTDSLLEPYGLGITGEYFTRFWVPLLGPAVTLIAQHIARHDGETTTMRHVGDALGLGTKHVERAMERAERFHLVRLTGSWLRGARFVAPLSIGQVDKLPSWLAAEHRAQDPRLAASSAR